MCKRVSLCLLCNPNAKQLLKLRPWTLSPHLAVPVGEMMLVMLL